MNENEIVTGTTAPTESMTATPVSEESVVSNESSVPDTGEMTEEITSDVSETESVESSLSLPEGIDADALVSSIAAEGVSEVMSEAGIEQETVVQTVIVTQPVVTEAVIVTEPVISETEMSETAEIVTEAAEVTDIVAEETEMTEVVSVPETPNGVMGFVHSNPAVVGVPAAIIALAVAFLAVTRRTRPKRGIIEDTDDVKENMNARERDAARLEANRPKKKDKRSQKVAKEKEKKDFAKKVLNTIPYKKILADDIFFLGKKMYSKAYTFDDINFNLSDEEQQYMYLERYIEFLSILDDTVDCQICCWNSQINLDDFKKKTLLPQKADDLFEYRYEFNSRVLEENIRKGQNAIQKHMYITLTIKAPDEETARRRFKSLDITATNTFNRIGNTNMRVLTSQERVEMLKDFFVGTDDMPVPQLTEKDFAKGIDKLYCAPDYFDFKKDYFMFNNTYAKTIYIREYPSTATSEILTELLATGIEIMVTTNIETYDSAEARKLVQHQITAIDTDMAKREVKAAQHGNFSNQMPQRIKNQRDAMVSVYDKITMKDQKLFMTNMQILIKAESYEELNNNLEVIESTLKRSGCIKGEMAWEQEHGMCDCLPIGYQRKFGWMRTMPSESVAIFMPFNVKEMQMENSVYYGLNMLSHNIILFDRMKGLVNPSGFVLACPGSGKSFTVKREIVNVFLGYEDADILVIDPEREYWKLAEAFGGEVVKFSNGSKNHINPFDFDFRLLEDEEIDIIADKCQLLTSFISCMDSKHPLNAQEKSFVDRCVRKAYAKSNVLTTLDPKDMPTLGTFLECMKEENENINKDMKDKLIITVDMYVNGSAKYFDNQTNVNTKSRFIAYDIRDLNGNLKTQSIHVDVWEEENSVSSEDMLADISKHLENMRKGVSSRDYHIELTDHDGNVRTLDNNFFDFVIEESKVIAETMDFPEIPIDEMGAAIDAENSRTDYGYEPAIGDILEKDDEYFRIADISDNIITIEETSSLFHESENMTLADFINRGYALVEKAEPAEKVKSPVDTRESVQTDEVKSPVDTYKNNYVITDENLGVNGPKARFNANIAAVEILKTIEAEGRIATPEEQKILSGYTGWGAIPQAFDPRNDDWKNEYEKLKTVLDDAEYSEARRSTLNAHYTSPVVINAIYEGLANLGFEKGKVLEPAMGIGNFFGVMPENMRGSELHGVELDDLTGRIANQLYPAADIQIKGFEKTAFENNSFDVVVGNVPFGNYKVNDKDYNKNNFLIHDYFIAKSLDKVHPGGVVAVVTSKGTMDKENDDIRKYIAQRAELLGAIRLPDTAFKANAGTEVVSDILFLQKRERPIEIDPDKEGWVKLGVSADGFDVNNYFAEHPEMVIGDFKEVSGRFGNEVTVKLDDPSMLKSLLSEAVQNIRGEYKAASVMKTIEEINADVIPAPAESRKFSYQAVNGELYYREAGDTMEKVPVKGKGKDKIARAVAMVELRDTVRELLDLQMNNSDSSLDESISESRAKLNKVYDAFVAKYGFVSDKKNKDAFKGDDDYQLLSALENEDKEHGTFSKADIFEHNTVKPKTIAEHVETAQEALIISISEKAKVDFEYMSELCGMDKDSMIADLKGQIFRLPQAEEKYVTSDEYLTGNIRKKIAELNNAPEGMDVSENRAALENAIPPRVEAKDISVKLGSHWIAPEYIRQFICEKFNPDWNAKRDMTVQYSKAAGEWKIEDVNAASKKNYTATNVFGTHRMHAYKILEGILNNSDLQVKDHKKDENGYDMRDEKGNYILVVNQEETKAVRQVANLIKSEFQDWIFKDPERREKLVQTYNEMYNSIRPREYDGSHLNFVGMNTDITLKEHQKNAIARALYGGNTLLAHAVGAGKTFEMIAIAMEGKRLGLHTKSLFAVPNSLTEQMGNDFRRLYPNANILVATKKDFEKANRLKLFAKIAANDWDAVIVGHTQFDRMGLSPEREQEYIKAELEKLREELEYAAEYGEKSFSVKKIENAIASYQDRLNKLNDAQVKDDFIDFEKLGFDKLFIDECHLYKNLATATKMHNVSGLGSGGAARSFNLLMKSKYMDEITGGKGQTYASGTPISNSMCELYTMMRYLQADMLKDCGINHFDEWAADFGEVKTDYELKPESDGKYQLKTRFAKFTNLPELMGMFKECADIRTADTLDLEKPEAHFHEIVAEPSRTQKKLIKSLSKRATAIRDGKVDPREDNMLVITNDGRKIGLDQRLINPILEDEEGSKVNLCVNNVYDIYSRTTDKRSTQCIFCDMSTPKSDSRQDRFEVYRPNSSKELGYELLRKKIGLGNGDEDNPKNINTFADVKSYIDKHSPEQSDKLSEGDIVVIRKPNMDDGKIYSQAAIFEDGKLNDVNSVELLEKLLMSDVEDIPPKEFNVYDDIKGKLMDRGVPENEIAFIHDYETAEQKQKLFDKMNAGEVRILLGSTQKCGAGMNAQAKMIALHHLDCPLRPSDVEQPKRNIEKHNRTSRNMLNKYAQTPITNADYAFFNTAVYPPTPGRYIAVLFHRTFSLTIPPQYYII